MKVIVKNNFKEYANPKSQKSISASIKTMASKTIEKDLKNIFETILSLSPVQTGAFITSWSLVPKGSGAGRMKSSKGKPITKDWEKFSSISRNQLYQDLDKIDNLLDGVVLRNRAPHAPEVERNHKILLSVSDRGR